MTSLAACSECGKAVHAAAGFAELKRQPSGEMERFCSIRCLYRWAEVRLYDAV